MLKKKAIEIINGLRSGGIKRRYDQDNIMDPFTAQ